MLTTQSETIHTLRALPYSSKGRFISMKCVLAKVSSYFLMRMQISTLHSTLTHILQNSKLTNWEWRKTSTWTVRDYLFCFHPNLFHKYLPNWTPAQDLWSARSEKSAVSNHMFKHFHPVFLIIAFSHIAASFQKPRGPTIRITKIATSIDDVLGYPFP